MKQKGLFVGEIKLFGGSTIPGGWLVCDGSAVSRTTYAALFSVIGTTYGSGNGSTTFNLPDFKGRMAIGVGNSGVSGDGYNSLGAKSGEITHKHTVGESITNTNQVAGAPIVSLSNYTGPVTFRPPYIVVNYIIYTGK